MTAFVRMLIFGSNKGKAYNLLLEFLLNEMSINLYMLGSIMLEPDHVRTGFSEILIAALLSQNNLHGFFCVKCNSFRSFFSHMTSVIPLVIP